MSLTSLSALASVSGFVKGNPSIDYYKVLGFSPELVADFDDEYYRAKRQKTTFDGLLTHSRLSNATMVDSDGLLKWGPHNLALNSASPATQSITVISGADYTVECTGVSIVLSGAGTGTVTEGNPVEITASTTTLTLTVTGSTGTMWCYRSDLGGMVNNPDTGNSYVPTTSSAVYLPRRGHHVYNGTSWVNEGLLIETEARSNLVTYSTPDNTNWLGGSVVVTENVSGQTAPDGQETFTFFRENTSPAVHYFSSPSVSFSSGLTYTFSVFVKKATTDDLIQLTFPFSAFGSQYANFNVSTGQFETVSGVTTHVQDAGNGVYRIGITATAQSTNSGSPGFVLTNNDDGLGRTPSYTGDNVNGFYVWGAQAEAGPTPSSYIPTLGSSVNRTPDILTIPSANLPWPTPKVIGPELVTNGTFDTDSDWTKIGTTTIAGGVLTLDANGTLFGAKAYQSVGSVSGKVYLVEFDVNSITSVCSINLSGPGDNLRVFDFDSTGHKSGVVVATGGYLNVKAVFTGSTCEIDNISVREIDPLAVSIQMDGRITYADTGTDNEIVFADWGAFTTNGLRLRLTTGAGGTGALQVLQAASSVIDTSIGSNNYTPGTFVPYNIASRHGSTFINGSVDGTSLNADLTPVALPDLSSTNLSLAYDYMGCIRQFRVWAADLGDSGIEEASEGEPSSYLIWDASADTYIQKVYD